MPKFFYTARSQTGDLVSGNREAKDEYELARLLKSDGYFLISATSGQRRSKRVDLWSLFKIFSGVSLAEKLMFTRNLQVMIVSGVTFPRALETLSLQARNQGFRQALLEIRDEVTRGRSFSEAVSGYPGIFSDIFCSMIKVGEETGNLDEVLKNLTNQLEREYELKSRILSAILYPTVIIMAMMGIGILMLIMVVPKLAQTFEELNLELPLATRLVIKSARFLTERWYVVAGMMALLFLGTRLSARTGEGKKTIDQLTLSLPIISPLVKKTNAAYAIRALSNLLASGVPIVRSLEIVSGTVGNFFFRKALLEAADQVRKGGKLSDALAPYSGLFPPIVIQMMSVGEETGQTADILRQLANFFEEEVANATKNLSSVLEPILMLIIGGVVGFFAISMIQPMYSMLRGV